MVSGGMACVKYLLFLFNLIFAVSNVPREVNGARPFIVVHRRDATKETDALSSAVPSIVSQTLFSVSHPVALSERALSHIGHHSRATSGDSG
jgi:hypothetical protein